MFGACTVSASGPSLSGFRKTGTVRAMIVMVVPWTLGAGIDFITAVVQRILSLDQSGPCIPMSKGSQGQERRRNDARSEP